MTHGMQQGLRTQAGVPDKKPEEGDDIFPEHIWLHFYQRCLAARDADRRRVSS